MTDDQQEREHVLRVVAELEEPRVGWTKQEYCAEAAHLLRRYAAALAQRPEQQAVAYGWLIENGKQQGEGLAYRFIDNDAGGVVAWTEDHNKALRFARREDAEQFCHHDEDAWRIVEHGWG